jgi:hypothetical protein
VTDRATPRGYAVIDPADLDRIRRDLAASLALSAPGPARTTIRAELDAVTAELDERDEKQP